MLSNCFLRRRCLSKSELATKIATGFVAYGAKVYIASRDKAVLDETAAELNKMVGRESCIALPTDLLKLDQCKRLFEAISAREKGEMSRLCARSDNHG